MQEDDYLNQLLKQPGSRQMTEDELVTLYEQVKQQIDTNFWFTFQPRGIQQKVINCFKRENDFGNYRTVLCIGPNQIGKTFSVLHYLMDFLTRRGEYRDRKKTPLHFGYWTKHRRFQRATLDTALLKYCGDYIKQGLDGRPGIDSQTGAFTFLKFKNEPENGFYGDLIQFETYEMDYTDIEGYVLDAIAMDEPHDHYNHYKYALQRIIEREGDGLCSMIPVEDTETEFYQRILKYYYEEDMDRFEFIDFAVAGLEDYAEARCKDSTCKHIEGSCKGWKLVRAFQKLYTPEEFDRKIAGKPGKITDMVYPFTKNKHVISPFVIPSHWRRDISIDYATSDNKWIKAQTSTTKELKKAATFGIFIATPPNGEQIELSDGRILVSTEDKPLYFGYKEYYWTNEQYKRLAQDHAQEICKLFSKGEKFQSILIDCAMDDTAFAEMKKVFDIYKQPHFRKILHGSKTRFKTAKSKEVGGHELVRQIIGNDQYYLFNNCEKAIMSEENYKIDKNTNEPRKYGDDYQDARRYYFATMPKWKDPAYLLEIEETDNLVYYDTSYLSDDYKISNYSFNKDFTELNTEV